MIRKILPLMLPVLGLVGGAMAGDMLRAPAEPAAHEKAQSAPTADHPAAETFFTFPAQFFVPLVRRGGMSDLMVLSLTLKTSAESVEAVEKKEHSLRDALLRQLMIHANTGGFDGNYTLDRNLARLRQDLLAAAQAATDLPIEAVLIEDIARQDG